MRHNLIDILACPICKGVLTLEATSEDGGEVLEGTLRCATCNEAYPITEGIPNLLPPDLRRAMETQAPQPGAAH